MRCGKKGSSIITILLLISTITLLVSSVWQTTTYALDVALQRLHYAQHYNATEGLLRYGIAAAQDQLEQLVEKGEQQELLVEGWPSLYEKYQSKVFIVPQNDSLLVCAQLMQKGVVICSLACVLEEQYSKEGVLNIVITRWGEDAA